MPRRAIPFMAGVHYHIYNRGNNRQTVFYKADDYVLFLRALRLYLVGNTQDLVQNDETPNPTRLVAYCLMPNHYHLLVCPGDSALSHRMQLLAISFTKKMNLRHHRVGALFQSQFKAIAVQDDTYLACLSAYFHLNPVRAGLVDRPEDWPYSSYPEYLGLRQGLLPSPESVLDQFGSPAACRQFVGELSDQQIQNINFLVMEEE
ncbi:MAG TPA: transposase [Anaerolineales bacterium]|nr:transposase [Anaerolineales bacterium]